MSLVMTARYGAFNGEARWIEKVEQLKLSEGLDSLKKLAHEACEKRST